MGPYLGIAAGHSLLCEVERCDRPSERGTEGEAAEYSRADQRKGKGSVGGSMAGVQVRAQMRLRGPTASVASVGARPHARGGRTARARPCAPRAVGGESVETVDLDLEEFNDVLSMVHDTDIVELSLKTSSFTLSVRKKEALEAEQQLYAQQAAPVAPVAAAPVAAAAPPPAPAAPAEEAPAPTPPQAGKAVTSPMSGTFYRSPAPGEPAFVKEGDTVGKGQKVCIIEAMKLMNEIEAEVSGNVLEILVEDGAPVTPGQPLMIIS